MYDTQYFLWDAHTKYVITTTAIPAVAYALAEGTVNIEIMPIQNIQTDSSELEHDLKKNNFNIEQLLNKRYIKVNIETPGWVEIDPPLLLAEKPSNDICDIINIINLRKQYITKFYQTQLAMQKRYCIAYDLNYMNSLGQALSEGSDNYLIEEYARINNISKDSAYNELKMKHDSYMLQIMRFYATFEMIKQKFNKAFTKEECEKIFRDNIRNAQLQY